MDRKKRDESIELLRCVLMFLIVLGHCCFQGAFMNAYECRALCSMTGFSVNAFAFISGYYSVKRPYSQFIRLLSVGGVWYLVLLLYGSGGQFGMGWYGRAYLILLLIVPFINGGVEFIYERCGRRGLLLAEAGLFTWMSLSWIGVNFVWLGEWQSHSPRQLLMMYLVGRTASKYDFSKIAKRHLFVAVVLCEIAVLAWSSLGHILKSELILRIKMWDYRSPLMVGCAIVVFHMFKGLEISENVKRVVRVLSPSMFGVYLIHHGTCGDVVRPVYTSLEKGFARHLGDNAIMHIMICSTVAVIVFLACSALDLLRRGLIKVLWLASAKLKVVVALLVHNYFGSSAPSSENDERF